MKLTQLLEHLASQGIAVSIEPYSRFFNTAGSVLEISREQIIHCSEYCRFVKRRNNDICNKTKHRSLDIAERGHRFSGVCPFGIWEMVQPVIFDRQVVAILYLGTSRIPEIYTRSSTSSGYMGASPPLYSEEHHQKASRLASFLRDFILYEYAMLRADNRTDDGIWKWENYGNMAKIFINLHFREDIQLRDVARHCGICAPYLGRLLVKLFGKTFRRLLLDRRMSEAEIMLMHYGENVGEIAKACGYSDSNYFSTVFSRYHGSSPKKFRDDWRDTQLHLSNSTHH